jgi:probable rRNA maturation factor
LGSPDGELSLVIVGDVEIADLNQRYLQRTGPTNVIAFPMQEGAFSDITPGLLGDVVISADTARKEALEAGLPAQRRFDALLVHGILHLFGYDHENDADNARVMADKAAELEGLLAGSGT